MNGNSNDTHSYNDIINLPRPISKNHPQMSIESRAAQFCPFAGLTGYDETIKETARLTDRKIELDDAEKMMISDKLQLIQDNIDAHPEVAVTFFQSDKRKDGGAYVDVTGSVKKVDAYEPAIVLTNGKGVPIDDVIAIDGSCLGVWMIMPPKMNTPSRKG